MALRRLSVAVITLAVMVSAFTSAIAAAPDRHAAIVIDGNTGKVLHQASANALRFPASLTKMMTLYLVFEQIKLGALSYDTKIVVSEVATNVAPSKLELEAGEEIALVDAIKALITKSANDMAVAVAERISGSEAAFARLMTERARQIGMRNTTFRNASGLPDPGQMTTARDMATLALRLHDDFPDQFRLFSLRAFTYRGKTYRTHNTLMHSFAGMDGIKTGYTRASGFNLVSSVHRDGLHLVGVVFGGATASARNAHMRLILQRAMNDASTEKTRVVKPMLVAKPVPTPKPARTVAAAQRPAALTKPQDEAKKAAPAAVVVAEAKPAPTPPSPSAPPSLPGAPVAAAAPETTPAAAAEKQPAPTPPIEIVSVRSVPMPLESPGGSAAPAAPAAAAEKQPMLTGNATPKLDFDALRQAIMTQTAAPQPSAPPVVTAAAAPAPTAPPSDRETVVNKALPLGAAPGRPPSTFEAQAAALLSASPPPSSVPLAAPPAGTPTGYVEKLPARPPSTLEAQAASLGQPRDTERAPSERQVSALGSGSAPAMRLQGPVDGQTPARTDYEIQIGAFASAEEAEKRMDAAKRQAPMLAAHAALALPLQDGRRTLYRARFAGFGRAEATDACNALKRQALDCMVVKPQ